MIDPHYTKKEGIVIDVTKFIKKEEYSYLKIVEAMKDDLAAIGIEFRQCFYQLKDDEQDGYVSLSFANIFDRQKFERFSGPLDDSINIELVCEYPTVPDAPIINYFEPSAVGGLDLTDKFRKYLMSWLPKFEEDWDLMDKTFLLRKELARILYENFKVSMVHKQFNAWVKFVRGTFEDRPSSISYLLPEYLSGALSIVSWHDVLGYLEDILRLIEKLYIWEEMSKLDNELVFGSPVIGEYRDRSEPARHSTNDRNEAALEIT